MQCAIDNAKRTFDIDINNEIKRIKKDLNIKENGYPIFWTYIKDNVKLSKVNKDLVCPMNYLSTIKLQKFRSREKTLPMEYFFNKFEISKSELRKTSRRVEDLIEKYSLNVYNHTWGELEEEDFFLLRDDFDELIADIRKIYISKNYEGLMSWLLNRAFGISAGIRRNKATKISDLEKNKVILMKVLYMINPQVFLKCWSKNLEK